MAGLKRPAASYLVGVAVAVAVAVFFIVNTLLVDSIEVQDVWSVLDVLMLIGLAIALAYNYAGKRDASDGDPYSGVTRRYLDVNAAYYLTVGVTIKPGSSGRQWTHWCPSSWPSPAAASGRKLRRVRADGVGAA